LINFGFLKDELAETRAQAALLAPAAARAEEIIKARTEMEEAIGEFDDILKSQKSWSGLMNDLGSIAPVDLWLTGLEISNKPLDTPPDNGQKGPEPFARPNQVSCKGIAGTLPSVGVFVKNLNGLPYFEEVKLVKVNAVSEGLEFEITAVVKDEG
jgi:type IV pilus assembly protein PilN